MTLPAASAIRWFAYAVQLAATPAALLHGMGKFTHDHPRTRKLLAEGRFAAYSTRHYVGSLLP